MEVKASKKDETELLPVGKEMKENGEESPEAQDDDEALWCFALFTDWS